MRDKEILFKFYAAGLAMPWGDGKKLDGRPLPRDGTGDKNKTRSIKSLHDHPMGDSSCLGPIFRKYEPGRVVVIDLRFGTLGQTIWVSKH